MIDGPLLWYLNRGSGVVALILLTLAIVLGVLALGGRPGGRLPRFVVQSVHRNVALLAVATLLLHVMTAVVDEYVDIRWWHALVPFSGSLQRGWLGLGAVALLLLAAVVASSVLRHRLRRRTWYSIHQAVWLMWLASVLHGMGMGSDLTDQWWLATVGCVAAVTAAAAWRVAHALLDRSALASATTGTARVDTDMTMPIRRLP
jgi:DMSO/TMAO reductase YedYZ heme-binding membrane subunit